MFYVINYIKHDRHSVSLQDQTRRRELARRLAAEYF